MMKSIPVVALLAFAIGCGPGPRHNGDDDDDDTVDARPNDCTPTEATETTCNDGFDNDCNGYLDCEDSACFDTEACPVQTCEIQTPSVSFALPDGNCSGFAPTAPYTDAQMEAFLATCGAYEGEMNLTGFPQDATLTDTSKLVAICVNMEHSWLRDMQMEAYCPNGTRVLLSKFQGQTGGEVFLGQPYEADEGGTPVPGVGWDYCWTMSAANAPMIDYANSTSVHDLPAGDYQPSQPFTGFTDCPLNGLWKIRIIDGWGIDNGFVFSTSMTFDPSLSNDCPVIE